MSILARFKDGNRREAIRELTLSGPDTVFYDGTCGLCHRAVMFVLRRDRDGVRFRFAPLHGPTFVAKVPFLQRDNLPDSLALQTSAGALLTRSNAVIYILRQLGGPWKTFAVLLDAIPRPPRDAAYGLVARSRFAVFGRTSETCPRLQPELRARFDP
jgi:predicted DCC family thiol-disulfide oxidoreductase YuxK